MTRSSAGRARSAAVVALVTLSVGSSGVASAVAGSELWVKRYNGTGNDYDAATAVALSPDGSTVFVTGQSTGTAGHFDDATVAYDASTGAKLWAKRYDGTGHGTDTAWALGVSPDGSKVFVTGYSIGSASGYDYATVAYDASAGSELWVKRYDGPRNGYDRATALGVSPDGSTVYVTGQSFGTDDSDYATLAYSASTGARLWLKRYSAGSGNFANALQVSPDGSVVFVTGGSGSDATEYDYTTVAYAASTGVKMWAGRYDGMAHGSDAAVALGVTHDGSKVFVTGYSPGATSGFDYATVAYAATAGTELWAKRYNGPGNGDEYGQALGVAPDGSAVFVTGRSPGSTSGDDYATVAYDASTGAKLWLKRYDGTGHSTDHGRALGVSPDGSTLFVTGTSFGSEGTPDVATLAYDAATGTRRWTGRYDGAANGGDAGNALAVSPDGSKVLVAGESIGAMSGSDYVTVAYSTA